MYVVLQNPSLKPVLRQLVVIHIVMYNSSIEGTQVYSSLLLAWRPQVIAIAAIFEHEADITMLCKLSGIGES